MVTLSLSSLKAARERMDCAPWSYDEPEPPAGSVDIRGAECKCDGDPLKLCPQHEHVAEWVTLPNAAGIVATHNAADVLIAVTEAALRWREAEAAFDAIADDSEQRGYVEALTRRHGAREALRAALAKVTL